MWLLLIISNAFVDIMLIQNQIKCSQNLLSYLVTKTEIDRFWNPPKVWNGSEAAFYMSFDSNTGLFLMVRLQKMGCVQLVGGKVKFNIYQNSV